MWRKRGAQDTKYPLTAACKGVFSSGERTRTSDLRVMSPTSYQLLYPAMLSAKVGRIPLISKFLRSAGLRKESDYALDVIFREFFLLSAVQVLELYGPRRRLVAAAYADERDGFPVGVVELFLQF